MSNFRLSNEQKLLSHEKLDEILDSRNMQNPHKKLPFDD